MVWRIQYSTYILILEEYYLPTNLNRPFFTPPFRASKASLSSLYVSIYLYFQRMFFFCFKYALSSDVIETSWAALSPGYLRVQHLSNMIPHTSGVLSITNFVEENGVHSLLIHLSQFGHIVFTVRTGGGLPWKMGGVHEENKW